MNPKKKKLEQAMVLPAKVVPAKVAQAVIRQALRERAYTQEEICKRIGRTRDDIVGDVDQEVARELELALGVNLLGQDAARAETALGDCRWAQKFPVRALQRAGLLGEGSLATGNAVEAAVGSAAPTARSATTSAEDLLRFMGVGSVNGFESYYGAVCGSVNPQTYGAWIRMGELQVKRPRSEVYLERGAIEENMRFLRRNALELRTTLRKTATELVRECGIVVLQVPAFVTAPAPLCATYWCGNQPVVQFPTGPISDVRFLKALFHAIGHILLHPKRTMCLQLALNEVKGGARDAENSEEKCNIGGHKYSTLEDEANLFAEAHLLSEAEECELICCGQFMSRRCIEHFSSVFKVRPSILVDRLQQQKKLPSKTLLNNLKVAV